MDVDKSSLLALEAVPRCWLCHKVILQPFTEAYKHWPTVQKGRFLVVCRRCARGVDGVLSGYLEEKVPVVMDRKESYEWMH